MKKYYEAYDQRYQQVHQRGLAWFTGKSTPIVAQVLEENPDMVAIVKGGNMKLINALTGKVMKVSNPKPNPKMVTEIILARLGL